jgi:hypothetical protein
MISSRRRPPQSRSRVHHGLTRHVSIASPVHQNPPGSEFAGPRVPSGLNRRKALAEARALLPDRCDHGRGGGGCRTGRAGVRAPRASAVRRSPAQTIATVGAGGAPRISGIEAAFEGGEPMFGSVSSARKGADLRWDPRFALHSATVDPVEGPQAHWPGKAKISGRAITAGPDGAGGDCFRADIADAVHPHQRAAPDARRRVTDTLTRSAKDRPRLTSRPRPVPLTRTQLRIVSSRARVDRPIRCITTRRFGVMAGPRSKRAHAFSFWHDRVLAHRGGLD